MVWCSAEGFEFKFSGDFVNCVWLDIEMVTCTVSYAIGNRWHLFCEFTMLLFHHVICPWHFVLSFSTKLLHD